MLAWMWGHRNSYLLLVTAQTHKLDGANMKTSVEIPYKTGERFIT